MLSLDLCDRAAAPEKPATNEMAAPAVGCRADGPLVLSDDPHVITNAAQSATKGSERGVANTSGVESTSQPTRGIRWPLRISTRRLIILAAIVLAIRIFVGEASVVPTASMEGTILVGDHLFMDKLLYGPEIPLVHWRLPALKTIHRGDIIVFRYPKDVTETFLKRVTALGGDRLEIKNGVLYVNSQPVARAIRGASCAGTQPGRKAGGRPLCQKASSLLWAIIATIPVTAATGVLSQ